MRAYITSGLNKDAHRIMKETGISWGLSFGVALKVQHIDLDLVLGNWGKTNVDSLARHFWALFKLYADEKDSRSYAFYKLAADLFKVIEDEQENLWSKGFVFGLKEFCKLNVKQSTLHEALDFLVNPRLVRTQRLTMVQVAKSERLENLKNKPMTHEQFFRALKN